MVCIVERNGSGESFGLLTKRDLDSNPSFFSLHCSSSLSYMNEYLAIDSSVCLYEQPSCINCSMTGCFTEKLKRCLIEQVCQGSKA